MKIKLTVLLICLFFLTGCNLNYSSISSQQFLKILVKQYEIYGANSLDLSKGLTNVKYNTPSANWQTTWENIATEYEQVGNKSFKNNDLSSAIYNLLKASVYFRISALPYPSEESQKINFQKSISLHRNAVNFLDNPPQIIRIPYETKEIKGYLRLPSKGKKYPLLIIFPGITGFKEDFFWVEDQFLAKGFAVFTMDIPGIGESQWAMRSDSDRVLHTAMKHIINLPDIISSKISIMGFNMGAYWAIRMAANQEYLIKNVIAVSPPINKAFSRERLTNLPPFLRKLLLQATGEIKFESLVETMGRFAFQNNDLLRDINAKIFLVGVKNDFFVPKEDLEFITSKTKKPVYYKLYLDEQFGIVNNLNGFFELSSGWLENNID